MPLCPRRASALLHLLVAQACARRPGAPFGRRHARQASLFTPIESGDDYGRHPHMHCSTRGATGLPSSTAPPHRGQHTGAGKRAEAKALLTARLAVEPENARLLCSMGDLTQAPEWYERAWAASGATFGRRYAPAPENCQVFWGFFKAWRF